MFDFSSYRYRYTSRNENLVHRPSRCEAATPSMCARSSVKWNHHRVGWSWGCSLANFDG
jgi:hypothetical protein